MKLRRLNQFTAMILKVMSTLRCIKTQTDWNEIIIWSSSFSFLFAVQSINPHKFAIQISTEEYDVETESNGLACQLVFTYTEKYPDTAPLVEIENAINFEDDFEGKLLEHINETVSDFVVDFFFFFIYQRLLFMENIQLFLQINDNLGIEMIFSLVSSAQEWLNVKWDEYKTEEENRVLKKQREIEEAEQVSQTSKIDNNKLNW